MSLWRFRVIIFAVEMQQYVLCVLLSRTSVTCVQILGVAQKERFCGELMSPVAMKDTPVFTESFRHYCSILTKLGFSGLISIEVPNTKFLRKFVQWEEQRDRQDHANRSFLCLKSSISESFSM